MIRPVNLGLRAEQHFRSPGVRAQIRRHGSGRRKQLREQVLVGRNQWVFAVENLEMDIAIVSIDGGLV